jgi:hypothetical protein
LLLHSFCRSFSLCSCVMMPSLSKFSLCRSLKILPRLSDFPRVATVHICCQVGESTPILPTTQLSLKQSQVSPSSHLPKLSHKKNNELTEKFSTRKLVIYRHFLIHYCEIKEDKLSNNRISKFSKEINYYDLLFQSGWSFNYNLNKKTSNQLGPSRSKTHNYTQVGFI